VSSERSAATTSRYQHGRWFTEQDSEGRVRTWYGFLGSVHHPLFKVRIPNVVRVIRGR